MRKLGTTLAVAIIASSALVATTVAPADAVKAKTYANCTKLAKDYPHGVSKGKKAAQRQVDDGYGRPKSGKKAKKVYKLNKDSLDRDDDGTACER